MTQFQGNTIQNAIESGMRQLNLQREQVSVDVISEGRKGFLGIGKRPALVDIKPLENVKTLVDVSHSTSEQIARIQAYLNQIVATIDYLQTATLIKNTDSLKFELQTAPENQAQAIGTHGKNINALQTIIQEYAYYLDFRQQPILLDCGDYRQRRQKALLALSTFKAEQVAATQKPAYLDPMPALERKIIYENLAANKQVNVRTQGKGTARYVVIRPVQQ